MSDGCTPPNTRYIPTITAHPPTRTRGGGGPMGGDSAERPILVVGCPRSGTTLLQVMLHAHSRIAIPPETKYLVEAYRARAGFGDLGTVGGRTALVDFVVGRPTFGDLGLDPDAVRDRIRAA